MNEKNWQKKNKLASLNESSENEAKQPASSDEDEKPSLEVIKEFFNDCGDFLEKTYCEESVKVVYLSTIIDGTRLEKDILDPISSLKKEDVSSWLKEKDISEATKLKDLKDEILAGSAAIFYKDKAYFYNVFGPEQRGVEKSDTESIIIGAHDAFVEDINKNLSLIRKRLRSSNLKVIKLRAGEITKTNIYVIYIDDLANMELVELLKSNIESIETDAIYDSSMVTQLIDEAPDSLFPQYYTTEVPEVVVSKLVEGKIVVLTDGSPIAFSAPTNFFEFLQSPDDYNQRYWIGTSLRILRSIAIFITVFFTALYVAVITFHYEVLPEDLLITLAESRARVPFPPLVEALIMEITIELLREAGARLPTKVGSTIGIVGGIVIGTAAVEAGFTSNVLIIAVASSAIASFVLPSYNMSNAIRIVRFFIIILAGYLGIFGMMIGLAWFTIHVASLTSLRTPYLIPLAPFYWKEWKDIFVRSPFYLLKERGAQAKTANKTRTKMKQ
ncbi:spore germination protein [Anaerobacillus alkaliphilus]|uniref:Spore germination protein n=1 Tax=Anaerobacillus alkaliphilus TaxID=1548597 RepID=A0A4Q0VNA5_9BACI|nr:spore germination protein [Anaerobacillus alkaliphilus]RXI97826.1 spore germination protein [Anaerobacillus alkaliphilus]